jgi:hypothetical protein
MKLFDPCNGMFNRYLGGGGGSPDLPPPPAPSPTPESVDIQAVEKGDAERRRLKSLRGRRSTILTEGTLGGDATASGSQQKKSLLGA